MQAAFHQSLWVALHSWGHHLPPGTPSSAVQCLLCFLKPATTHTLPRGGCNAGSARPWYPKLRFTLTVKDHFSSGEKNNHFQDGPLEGGFWGHRHQAYPETQNPDPMIDSMGVVFFG